MQNEKMHKIALQEYYHIQGEIGRFDDIAHRVKNWSITLSIALAVAGFHEKMTILFLLMSGAATLFWLTEGQWKRYQQIQIRRVAQIEPYLLGKDVEYHGPAILSYFTSQFGGWKTTWNQYRVALMKGNVIFPHLIFIVTGLTMFVIFQCELLAFPNLQK